MEMEKKGKNNNDKMRKEKTDEEKEKNGIEVMKKWQKGKKKGIDCPNTEKKTTPLSRPRHDKKKLWANNAEK